MVSNLTAPPSPGCVIEGPDDTAPGRAEESDGMAHKAPQFQANLALKNLALLMQLAASKQFCESSKHIKAQSITTIVVGEEVQPDAQKCRGVGHQRHIDARALFARFATLSTLSTADLNRLNRSGSHPMLDEREAPTLDATGLRHVLRGVGLSMPNSTSVRPMLAEFGEVVGCQERLTYAQFEMLCTALNACGGDVAAAVAKHRAVFKTKTHAVGKATVACEGLGWLNGFMVCT